MKHQCAVNNIPWGVRTVCAFEKLAMIGQGSYGLVWKARDIETGQLVALKQVKRCNTPEGLPRTTLREIRILQRVQHANIVRLLEVVVQDTPWKTDISSPQAPSEITNDQQTESSIASTEASDDATIYMVFEYVEYDLTGLRMSHLKITPYMTKVYMYQLLLSLQHIHSQGYIHRDLKASNILITDDNQLKLADFGLSRRWIGPKGNMTNNVITLWYRPPELILGATNYTFAVDMWSVGCILLELLLCRPLFAVNTESALLHKIFKLLGSPTKHSYLTTLPKWDILSRESAGNTSTLASFLDANSTHGIDANVKQLIHGLLQLDPHRRISAAEALKLPYFQDQTSSDRLNLQNPMSVLPRLSSFLGHAVDYHEYSTKQRRKNSNEPQSTVVHKHAEQAKQTRQERHQETQQEINTNSQNHIHGISRPENGQAPLPYGSSAHGHPIGVERNTILQPNYNASKVYNTDTRSQTTMFDRHGQPVISRGTNRTTDRTRRNFDVELNKRQGIPVDGSATYTRNVSQHDQTLSNSFYDQRLYHTSQTSTHIRERSRINDSRYSSEQNKTSHENVAHGYPKERYQQSNPIEQRTYENPPRDTEGTIKRRTMYDARRSPRNSSSQHRESYRHNDRVRMSSRDRKFNRPHHETRFQTRDRSRESSSSIRRHRNSSDRSGRSEHSTRTWRRSQSRESLRHHPSGTSNRYRSRSPKNSPRRSYPSGTSNRYRSRSPRNSSHTSRYPGARYRRDDTHSHR